MNEELKERLAQAMWLDTEGGNRRESWEDAEKITRETYLSNVEAILAELAAAGYAVVPKGSSITMEEAGSAAISKEPNPASLYTARVCYYAMLAAAEEEG